MNALLAVVAVAAVSLVASALYRRRMRLRAAAARPLCWGSDDKPQSRFKRVLADNSERPFEHLQREGQGQEMTSKIHPYEKEINLLLEQPPTIMNFVTSHECPDMGASYVWIHTEKQLEFLARLLSKEQVFAVDTEQHSVHSFLGFTALMQVSTETEDFLIDTIALHDVMGILRPVFADPTICKVYKGNPQNDKAYLFLFCELKGVFENYQQVLADKDIIGIWKSKPKDEIYHLMNSSIVSIPKSLVLAKQIVSEKNLQLGSWDMVECLENVCTTWLWEEDQLAYKKYEEFLLEFWKKNLGKLEPEEICAKFCSGSTENLWKPTPEEIYAAYHPKGTGNLWDPLAEEICSAFSSGVVERKYCTVSSCANPGSGKPCVGLTHYAMKQAGKKLVERLCERSSTEECSQIIEENYKTRLSKPCSCRVHYIKSKLEEAEKTGLADKIRELIPSFKDLAVRNVDMDLESANVIHPVLPLEHQFD